MAEKMNDAYTNQVKVANPYIKKVAKQATDSPCNFKKFKKADLVKEIESLKDWNVKLALANRNYASNAKILEGSRAALATAEKLIAFKDVMLEEYRVTSKGLTEALRDSNKRFAKWHNEKKDLVLNKNTWAMAFFASLALLIITNGWRFI